MKLSLTNKTVQDIQFSGEDGADKRFVCVFVDCCPILAIPITVQPYYFQQIIHVCYCYYNALKTTSRPRMHLLKDFRG